MSTSRETRAVSWFEQEQKENYAIMKAWWDRYVVTHNMEGVNRLKEIIQGFQPPKEDLERVFSGISGNQPTIDFDTFYKFCSYYLPSPFIWGLDGNEKFGITSNQDIPTHITAQDLKDIEQYKKEAGITGTICIGCMAVDEQMYSPENQPTAPYAIHSVGKVLTGVLMLKLIEHEIILKENIDKPIKDQISETAWNQLPINVRKHLEENRVTLRQVMTHKGGLGDYLPNYTKAIAEGNIPEINQPEDFIPYIEDKTNKAAIDKEEYSNVGILLVGLAIKHACKDQDYNGILAEYVLKEAGVSCVSHKPTNGVYNESDTIAPHIVGGPSGGYWMTVEDLAKFGKWLYLEYKKPHFESLMREYGQEFYFPQFNKIAHDGRIPSANAHFAIYLKTGIIVSVLSDQPNKAVDLGFAIKRHIFCDRLRNERLLSQDIEATKDNAKLTTSSTLLVAKKIRITPNINTKKMATDDIALQPTKAKKAAQEFAQPVEKKRAPTTDDSNITYGSKRPGK